MTDKQLALLVRAWANRLGREIDLARESLPADMPRVSERQYIGPTTFGATWPADQAKPENWRETPGDYAILVGLTDLLAELETAAEALVAPAGEARDGR